MNGRDLKVKTIPVRASELERAEAELLAIHERRSVSALFRIALNHRISRYARTHPKFAKDLHRLRDAKDPLTIIRAMLNGVKFGP